MAVKLSPEELEKIKMGDFEPPTTPPKAKPEKEGKEKTAKKARSASKKTAPKETPAPDEKKPAEPTKTKTTPKKKTLEQKKNEEQAAVAISQPAPKPEKHAGGRPRKSDEETRVYSFRLTERTVRRLRVLAALQGVSAADIIAELADRENVPGLDN